MFNLAIILFSTLNTEELGATDYRIARFMLDNIRNIQHYTISQFAKECFVSNSSVSRFCRTIGFNEFSELKGQLYKVADVSQTKFCFSGKEHSQLLTAYVDAVTSNLEKLKNSLDMAAINTLVQEIHAYPKVAAFGSLQSHQVALNLQADLFSSNKIIDTNIKFSDQLHYMNQADEKTLMIIFSKSGEYFSRATAHNLSFKTVKGPKIYLITDNARLVKPKFVDSLITFESNQDYAAHPYPLEVVKSLIAMEYARLFANGS